MRFFRRYPTEISFDLTIEGRTLRVRTVDYSLIGVGLVIDDPDVRINNSDPLELRIDELDIHETGMVAWIQRRQSEIRVGILRTKPFIGRLALYPLSDILIGLQRTLKTGMLRVDSGEVSKTAYIMNGNIIYATSNHEKDRLASVLLKARKINKKQFEEAERIKKTGGKHYPAVLVGLGYIKPADVIEAVKLQAKRIVESLFLMREASFEFIEGPLPSRDVVTIKLSVSNFVFREVKKNADVGLIEKYLIDSIIDFSSNPLDLFQDIRLKTSEKALLYYVDGNRSIREIAEFADPDSRINPLKVIYGLLEARLLRIREVHELPSGIRYADVSREKAEKIGDLCDSIDIMYSRYHDLDYYDILNVDQHATADEIKKAYYRTAKKYHPDVHPMLPADAKKKLLEIFTYITNAYLTLSDADLRSEYDKLIMTEETQPETEPSEVQTWTSVMQNETYQKEYESQIQREAAKKAGNKDIAGIKFRDGKIAFWDKKYDEAARLFAAAIYFDASMPEYHYFYGRSLAITGKLKEAAQPLNRANELLPGNAEILAELGHIYMGLNFPLRAKGFFNKAIEINPKSDRALAGIRLLKGK